jgi:hypothetical protein
MIMKLSLAAAIAMVALSAIDAQALPMAPSMLSHQTDEVIQVRQGCGFGRHRGPRGGCRVNVGPSGAYAAGRCWWRGTPWGPRRVCN